MSTYTETIDFLYAQLPMYHRIGAAAYKKDLTNTLALCEHLGNPHHQFRSIHVGGTNGKGSVSHMLAAYCQSLGLKTGLYISPHYKDFRERIKIDGRYIPRKRVIEFVQRNREAIEKIQPSFFELCVAMAFDHFAREKVDVAIVEVGLGGRLDSTNVITPVLSVITNISFDHMDTLGDTLPKIAFEKAGIIKPGVPVVIGETHPESAPVFEEKARSVQSPIFFADQVYSAEEIPESTLERTVFSVKRQAVPLPETLPVDAAGPYLARNVVTVLKAVEELERIGFAPKGSLTTTLPHALARLRPLTRFMGRWQVIGQRPTVLCDSAHNEAGIRLAFEKIKTLPFNHLHIVTGFVNDKDIDKVLPLFPDSARYYFAKADIPRGLDARILREKAALCGMKGRAYRSVKNALGAARRAAMPDDLVVVIGSIFVVAEAL